MKRLSLEVGQQASPDAFEKLAKDAGFTGSFVKKMGDFAGKMFACFDSEDAQYLEVNPVVLREQDMNLSRDAVTAAARWRCEVSAPRLELCLLRQLRPCLFQDTKWKS